MQLSNGKETLPGPLTRDKNYLQAAERKQIIKAGQHQILFNPTKARPLKTQEEKCKIPLPLMGILKRIITKIYGFRMKVSKLTGMGIDITHNPGRVRSPESFYDLKATANSGEEVSFDRFRGKKVLIVNLASQCGFTPQYNELEELYQLKKDEVIVLGFPSNDFGGQEPGTDKEIENYCRVNFGVTFPLFQKDHVTGHNKQPVYQWLSNAGKNGWNDEEPSWNFYKYLVDEHGHLDKIFSSSVSPLEIIR